MVKIIIFHAFNHHFRVLLSAGPVWDENLVSVIQTLVDNKVGLSYQWVSARKM